MISIYALRDPRDGRIRYVGQTGNGLSSRLSGHVSTARAETSGCAKDEWLRVLDGLGLTPSIELLETTPTAAANDREAHWIDEARGRGESLLNVASPPSVARTIDGGPTLRVVLPPDVRALIDAEVKRINATTPGAAATVTSVIVASIRAHCGGAP